MSQRKEEIVRVFAVALVRFNVLEPFTYQAATSRRQQLE